MGPVIAAIHSKTVDIVQTPYQLHELRHFMVTLASQKLRKKPNLMRTL